MKRAIVIRLIMAAAFPAGTAQADTLDDLLAAYRGEGAGAFETVSGEELWQRSFPSRNGTERACTSCHTSDPRQAGRHAVTGKAIDPIAPSANPKRLTDRREIEKWLKRNCKWTLGRECTAQEKGDLLSFLRSQ